MEHGFPKEIVTDRGSPFIGKVVVKLNERMHIKHKKSTSYHPISNGQAERTNFTMIDVLACLALEYGSKWTDMFKWTKWAYNTTFKRSTGYEPYFLKYGRSPIFPIDLKIPSGISKEKSRTDVDMILERAKQLKQLNDTRGNVLDILQLGYDKRRRDRLQLRNVRLTPLKIGERVVVWDSRLDKQWSGKLEPKWIPKVWRIQQQWGNGSYDLVDECGNLWKNNPVSGARLKQFF